MDMVAVLVTQQTVLMTMSCMTHFVDRLLIHVITYLQGDFMVKVAPSTDMIIWAIGFVVQVCVNYKILWTSYLSADQAVRSGS